MENEQEDVLTRFYPEVATIHDVFLKGKEVSPSDFVCPSVCNVPLFVQMSSSRIDGSTVCFESAVILVKLLCYSGGYMSE